VVPRATPLHLPLAGVAAVAIVLTPLLVTLLLVHGVIRASLHDFVPATDDEMYYWHQIASFSRVGFASGNYT
jgi:hypothetical protein